MITKNNWLTFDGKSTKDFGVYLVGNAVYNAPEREYEKISIPGKSGDLLIDNNRYGNVEIPYSVIVYDDFDTNVIGLRNYLLSKTGYHRLEDTYFPEEYRIARYSGGLELESLRHSDIGTATITFDCKPQRFLKSGEITKIYTSNNVIYNPTFMQSKPLLRVYGTGDISIGDRTITIVSADVYTDIDCDLQDAYKGTVNCNGNIVLASGNFFVLNPGVNGIYLGNGITRVEITPRWWVI